ncbi:MAG: FKBP-type peptidyl-prolyl cis-trans isomerase [Gammaproteobacteria bacterium]|nr:MAG: FKBP-type peptidyl-prolyl cis-trans isomerase [Gammaproteobacteria bacterium]
MFKVLPAMLGCIGLVASMNVLADTSLNNQKDKQSYAIGVNLGMQLSQQKEEINLDNVIMGLKDVFSGQQPKMTMEEMQQTMMTFQQTLQEKQQARMQALADTNAKEGKEFLAANKKKEGVKTLPSGLQYKVLQSGKGESPKVTDTVVTHYRGSLIDGRVFDSSYQRGEPATFPVNGVIKGWTEALQKMKVGDKWQLFIPAELGYGEHGAGQMIGPNAVLIFEIELLEIKKS